MRCLTAIWVSRLIWMSHLWAITMSRMSHKKTTDSYVTYVTCLRDTTHSCVKQDWCICVPWLTCDCVTYHMRLDTWFIHVWLDMISCVTRFIHVWLDMCGHDSLCVMSDMNESSQVTHKRYTWSLHMIDQVKYSPFPGRWDSKCSPERKSKSWMVKKF